MTDEQEFAEHKMPWVVMVVADQFYALPIRLVQEMVPMEKLTAMPTSSKLMRGLMTRRGTTLPVLDTRTLFDLPANSDEALEIVVVLEQNGKRLGLAVDAVDAVEELPKRSMYALSQIENAASLPVRGVAMRGEDDHLVLLMDSAKLFSQKEVVKAVDKAVA